MSNSIKKLAWAFSVFFIVISIANNSAEARSRKDISLQVFYDELAYHGDWVDNPDYGYVWRPNVGSDFRPYYTNGHWVMTEYGNTWVSDYEWGWAPFHYGRWFYDKYDGWIWTPDTEWGPAWVTWRTGGGYYGWAPLGPRININVNIGRGHYVPDNYWVFIPQRCIYYPSYSRYWEPRRNVYIVNNTTIINNIYTNERVRYYSGPGRDDVRRATRRDVPVYRVSDNSRPGSDRVSRGEVGIYRPNVDRSGDAAPRTIASNTARPSRGDVGTERTLTNTDRSSSTWATRPERSGTTDNRTPSATTRSDTDRSSTSSRPERTEAPRSNVPNRTEGTRSEAPGRSDVDRSSNSSTPERTEPPRSSMPERTESTRSSMTSSSPQRSETQSSRPERVERSAPAPREQSSAPSRSAERSGAPAQRTQSSGSSSSAERSSAPSSSGSSSSSSSSRSGGSGRPSR